MPDPDDDLPMVIAAALAVTAAWLLQPNLADRIGRGPPLVLEPCCSQPRAAGTVPGIR